MPAAAIIHLDVGLGERTVRMALEHLNQCLTSDRQLDNLGVRIAALNNLILQAQFIDAAQAFREKLPATQKPCIENGARWASFMAQLT